MSTLWQLTCVALFCWVKHNAVFIVKPEQTVKGNAAAAYDFIGRLAFDVTRRVRRVWTSHRNILIVKLAKKQCNVIVRMSNARVLDDERVWSLRDFVFVIGKLSINVCIVWNFWINQLIKRLILNFCIWLSYRAPIVVLEIFAGDGDVAGPVAKPVSFKVNTRDIGHITITHLQYWTTDQHEKCNDQVNEN